MQTINLSIHESYFSARIKTRPKFTEKDSTIQEWTLGYLNSRSLFFLREGLERKASSWEYFLPLQRTLVYFPVPRSWCSQFLVTQISCGSIPSSSLSGTYNTYRHTSVHIKIKRFKKWNIRERNKTGKEHERKYFSDLKRHWSLRNLWEV